MKTYEVLEKALALIEDEKNWCTGTDGWRAEGPYCAEGALGVAACVPSRHGEIQLTPLLDVAAWSVLSEMVHVPESGWGIHNALWVFNDHHTHAEVVALFQRAVRDEKAKEGIEVPLVSERPAEPIAIGAGRG